MRKQNLFRPLVAGALALAMCLPLPAALAAESPFSDVAANAWYAGAVEHCQQRDLMDGMDETTFAPNELMTRAVLAEALYRLEGRPESEPLEGAFPFSDVAEDSPYAAAILWACQRGIVSGYEDGTFGPDRPITREQIAAIFWQAQGRQLAPLPASYSDRESVSNWAIDAVEWVSSAGLMSGKPEMRFDPAGHTTRAEGATILQAYDKKFYTDDTPELPPARPDPEPIPPNRYDSAAFVLNENGYLTYTGDTPSYIGLDVSSHQKSIDWERVAATGLEFAMIRAGYRGYTVGSLNRDGYFSYNIENALANGLEVGVYFYSQAITPEEAEEEARLLLSWIKDYDITYPVVFDWEVPDDPAARTQNVDGPTITACAQAFCSVIEQAGYVPMTYGSPSKVYNNKLELGYLQDWPFWLAHYTKDLTPTAFRYHYDMWQYTSDGTVDGIEGRVDLNICLADWDSWGKG